jgi:hypothetical protein
MKKQELRVLVCNEGFSYGDGGISGYMRHMMDSLRSDKKKKYSFTILTYKWSGVAPSDVSVVVLPYFEFAGIKWNKSSEYKNIPKHDLVFTNTRFFTTTLLGMELSDQWLVPHIHVEHGAGPVPHHNPFIRFSARIWDKTIGKDVFNHADKVVCVCEAAVPWVRKTMRGSK